MLQCVISSTNATETEFCRVCPYGYRESQKKEMRRKRRHCKQERQKEEEAMLENESKKDERN